MIEKLNKIGKFDENKGISSISDGARNEIHDKICKDLKILGSNRPWVELNAYRTTKD